MPSREGAQGHRRNKGPAPQEGLRVARRRAGVAGGRDTLAGVVPAERREPHTTAVVFYRQASGPDRANGPSARRVEPQRAPTANILGLIEFVPMVALTPRPERSSNLCANENTTADQAFGVNKGAAPVNLSGRLKKCRVTPAIRSAAFARGFGCPPAAGQGPIPRVLALEVMPLPNSAGIRVRLPAPPRPCSWRDPHTGPAGRA